MFLQSQYLSPEALINGLPGLFFLKDKDSHYVAATQHFKQFCEYTGTQNVVSCSDYDLSWANRADAYREADRRVMAGESIAFLEPLRLREGKDITVVSRKSPFYDLNQKIIGIGCHLTIVSSPTLVREITTLTKNDFELLTLTKHQSIHYSIKDNLTRFNLSKQELRCLYYLIHGKTAKEISIICSRSKRTIEKHIINIKHKLHCDVKSDIITKAIEYGFVHLIPNEMIAIK